MKLLERERLLDQLADLLAEAERGKGRLVLVAGEAGIGKTALVDTFCRGRAGPTPLLWGCCDAVVPARPFAPLGDIAEADGTLQRALHAADRDRVFEAFLALARRLSASKGIIVFDDLHWADDATFDLLRVVGRRLRELSILVIGTYRDDEVGSGHPLRLALGDMPADAITELRVPRLSIDAVRALAKESRLDGDLVYRVTEGNAFFVTEVLAAGDEQLPAAVSDSVLARAARLTPSAQHALAAASVLGERSEPRVVCDVAECDPAALDECVARGMLERDGETLRFRHELAQRAVRERLTASERVGLHIRALEALRGTGAGPAELLHHAVEAGDTQAVAELAPPAADRAASLGAHREAVAHYAAALNLGGPLEERSRAELLEAHGREALAIDDVETALASQNEALSFWRDLGDIAREASCLRALSSTLWAAGDVDGAVANAELAVELLTSISAPDRDLGRAYATLAQRHFTRGVDDDAAIRWAEGARTFAERANDELAAVHALTTIGVTEVLGGAETGWVKLQESVARAKSAGFLEEASRALINIIEAARDTRTYTFVDRYREEALRYMKEENPYHDLYRRRLIAVLAEVALERGAFEEAERLTLELVSEGLTAKLIRVKTLTVLGRLKARRGDPAAGSLLEDALALADPRGEAQDLCPLFAARAEAAWLEGDATQAGREAESGLALAMQASPMPWWRGELGFWGWRSGALDQLPVDSAEPFLLHASGRLYEAATSWEAIGCPYQQALALADAPDEESLQSALRTFRTLGATPMARTVVQRLRERGVRQIPSGPRRETRGNPAGLTSREVEVLVLLTEGMRNAQIAERLVVSPKTVDHHVSAILRKLAVPNRAAAADEARRLGLEHGDVASAE